MVLLVIFFPCVFSFLLFLIIASIVAYSHKKKGKNNFSLFTLLGLGKTQVFNPGILTEKQRSLKYLIPTHPPPHLKMLFIVLLGYFCYLTHCV